MFPEPRNRYHRCFVSAPIGLDLGYLPDVLTEKQITWEWANEYPVAVPNVANAIRGADFFVGVINATQADYRVLYEAGIATGLNKPILMIVARKRPMPFELKQ